jgi:hypothetical protein
MEEESLAISLLEDHNAAMTVTIVSHCIWNCDPDSGGKFNKVSVQLEERNSSLEE